MSALKTYDPTQMSVIAGPYVVTDFDSLSIEQDEDDWALTSGSAGELTRTYNANRAGKITIVLPQTNSVNLSFASLAASKAVFTVAIVDSNGFSVHTISQASVLKRPMADYAKAESGTREWVFIGALDDNISGGN